MERQARPWAVVQGALQWECLGGHAGTICLCNFSVDQGSNDSWNKATASCTHHQLPGGVLKPRRCAWLRIEGPTMPQCRPVRANNQQSVEIAKEEEAFRARSDRPVAENSRRFTRTSCLTR